MTRRWADNPNAAYYLAVQAGVPAMAEGGTGEAKSQAGGLALARALGKKFVLLIGSACSDTDFAGFPSPDKKLPYMPMIPTKKMYDCINEPCLLFIDEATAVDGTRRAPMMSIFTERQMGDYELHPDTLIAGACNPPDVCPNGSPFEPAMCNRFYHHEWQLPFEDWAEGMVNKHNWSDPAIPVLPADWRLSCDRWDVIITGFLRKNPKMKKQIPTEDGQKSFSTLRAHTNLALALGAADACNAPTSIHSQLIDGLVGEVCNGELMAYYAALDLCDPEEVLDGNISYTYDEKQYSQAACLTHALLACLSAKMSPTRFENGMKALCDIGDGNVELVIEPFRRLLTMIPDGHAIKASLQKRTYSLLSRLK